MRGFRRRTSQSPSLRQNQKRNADDQFENFERVFRSVISVPGIRWHDGISGQRLLVTVLTPPTLPSPWLSLVYICPI